MNGIAKPQNGSSGKVKWVNEEKIQQLLTWDALLPAVSQALQAYSRGADHPQGAVQPMRSKIDAYEQLGFMLTMPAMVKGESLSIKVLSIFPNNKYQQLSIRTSIILLMNPNTGHLAAILEGNTITEMRTAAASAVATIQIFKDKDRFRKDNKLVVAVLGAGVQARSHARVMAHVFNVDKIVIWARRIEAAETLCKMLNSEGITATAADTIQQAVMAADIINCCTTSSTPLFEAQWVKLGVHINAVGSISPDKQELEEDLVRSAIIYVDSYESVKKESGDIIASGAEVYAEIGEVLLGTKPVIKDDKITIFKSLGLAVEDAASAQLVYDAMIKEG